jgi:hypothetical protein
LTAIISRLLFRRHRCSESIASPLQLASDKALRRVRSIIDALRVNDYMHYLIRYLRLLLFADIFSVSARTSNAAVTTIGECAATNFAQPLAARHDSYCA